MYHICFVPIDRVVDELNPESNFTWKDVTTLIQDDEDDGPVQDLSKFASSYTDRVLKYLVSEMSPSLSKVSNSYISYKITFIKIILNSSKLVFLFLSLQLNWVIYLLSIICSLRVIMNI